MNFAEKVSLTPFPFAAGLGGNMKQMKRRILNIASYEKPTFMKRIKGITAFVLTAVLLIGFAPFISTYAADGSHYTWNSSSANISYVDLSSYFGEFEGKVLACKAIAAHRGTGDAGLSELPCGLFEA